MINSGLVHAICSGLVIAEIQQNSDITYRVYDYGRPREIHVEKSLEVIDFNSKPKKLVEDDTEFFSIITCVEGKGAINYKNKTEIIAKGDSILIPVQLGEYEIKGEVEILISKPVI